jgi:predicted RNase H-like HicB family nuclease
MPGSTWPASYGSSPRLRWSTRTYRAALHRASDGSFGISFPAVLGCVSAGDTVSEALVQGRRALAFHLRGMIEDGEAMP